MSAAKMPTPVLSKARLYLGDNGRAFCGGCAGMSALYTGRDISGQRVAVVDAPTAKRHGLACETCGMVPTEPAS